MGQIKSFLKKQGFTLVELIIVIAIIAVLAVAAFMMLTKWLGKSRDSRRLGDLKTIQTGLEIGYADVDVGNGLYPDISDQNGAVLLFSGTDTSKLAYQGVVDISVANKASLQKVPLDPSDNNEYTYLVTANRKKFQIMAMLEDGTETTAFINSAYALDYKNRIASVRGYDLGVLLEESTNLPIQYSESNLTGLNLSDSDILVNYIAKTKDGEEPVSGTGIQELEIYTQEPIIGNNEPVGETYSCQGSLVTANANITNNTGLIEDTTYQNDNPSGKCYYECNSSFKGDNCDVACPTGFISVPGNSDFNTEAFCVAKYEMSYDETTAADCSPSGWETRAYNSSKTPVSMPNRLPVVNITQKQALDSCAIMGEGYHLITNNEWMTIARNIESQDENWSNGTVGNGHIWNGVSNDTTLGCAGNTVGTWAEPTGSSCGAEQRNKLTLSNGSQIWDLAGNVWEHVNRGNNPETTTVQVGAGNLCGATGYWHINGNPSTTCAANYGPIHNGTNGYTINIGMGHVRDGTGTDKIFVRGSIDRDGDVAGIYSLLLTRISTSQSNLVGFRCAK